jgi:hypothetical protein
MRIWSRNLTTLFTLLVKRTSSSYGVARRFGNRTLPFSHHKENCGLLLLDFANHSLIHIFALQNLEIVSISPQSHRVGADAFSSPNNYNASLPREGCARVVTCYMCTVHHSWHKRLLRSCGILNGLADSICCLARRSFYKRLRCSHTHSDMSWLNSTSDALPTLWWTQMWVQTENNRRVNSRNTLPGSQHFNGVEGRVGAPGWD